MRNEKTRGITLVALVVTVIILLILAGISVAMLTGTNGIVNKANYASIETRKAEYEEQLKLIQTDLNMDKIINQWTAEEYIEEYLKRLGENKEFTNAKIEKKDDQTIQVTTKEGDVFIITEDKIEYQGTQGKNPPPDLQENDINVDVNPSGWTNTDVEATISTKIEGYSIQYSTDGQNWENYTKEIPITKNQEIYVRLINNLGEIGGYTTANIKNIDKEPPTVEIGTNGGDYTVQSGSTITVTTTITASDLGGSELDILQYQFSTSETVPSDSDSNWKEFTNGGTITETIPGGTYYLYTKVTDNAGNRAEQGKKSNAYIANYTISLDNQGATTAGTTAIYGKYGTGIYLDAARNNQMTTSANGITIPQKAYTVTYNCNGGSGATSAQANHTFGGYYTGTNGSGTQMIANNGMITSNLSSTTYSGNTSLFAKWSPVSVTLPNATKTNYTFQGWYTAASGGSKIGNASASYTPTGNTTLYAQWRGNPTVSFTKELTYETVSLGNNKYQDKCTVYATGNGTLTYQWYKYYEDNGSIELISGATSASITGSIFTKIASKAKVTSRAQVRYYQLYCVVTCNVGGVTKSITSTKSQSTADFD